MSQSPQPKATVVAYIKNSVGEILLIRSPKWANKLIPPGGHIEYGETAQGALMREVKEETGLTIQNPKLLTAIDMIEEPDFARKEHFVGLEFVAELANDTQEIILDAKEAAEYVWLSPQAAASRDDVERWTRQVIINNLIEPAACDSCDQYKAGWARAQADYQNLQKEVEQKRSTWVQMSEVQILEEFIPIYDNFKKAFAASVDDQATHDGWKNWQQGIAYIKKQFGDVLKHHGIEEIQSVGKAFDPSVHEAMGEDVSKEPDGTVLKELEGGYMAHGKVIKPAKVIVSKS